MEPLLDLWRYITNPNRLMPRGRFNLLVWAILLPITLLQAMVTYQLVDQSLTSLWSTGVPTDIGTLMNDAEREFRLIDLLQLLGFVALMPCVYWRMNDLGWRPYWLLAIYLPLLLDVGSRLSDLPPPALLSMAANMLALVLLGRLCSKRGKTTEK